MLTDPSSHDVGVILVNWNGSDVTIPCIDSLKRGNKRPSVIVVVDNASIDDSPSRIKAAHPDVLVVLNTANLGFAAANNVGICQLLENRDIRYIWLLNNDTLVTESCLKNLCLAAEGISGLAAFSGKIFYENPRDEVWYGGAFRNKWNLCAPHLENDSLARRTNGCPSDVDFISGCCIFAPAATFLRFGGLRSDFFMYSEDNEWCWRVKNGGGRLIYVPAAVLTHRLNATVKKSPAAMNYIIYPGIRNNLWTIRLHSDSLGRKMIAITLNLAGTAKVIARCAKMRRHRAVGYAFLSIIAGLFNRISPAAGVEGIRKSNA